MATQYFFFSNSEVELEFKIDVHTLSHFSEEAFGEDFDQKKGIVLNQYINENLDLTIDGSDIKFELISSNQNENYLIIKLRAAIETRQNADVVVKSDLFYEFDASFQNRIIIAYDDEQKSYRLNHTNNSIKINLP